MNLRPSSFFFLVFFFLFFSFSLFVSPSRLCSSLPALVPSGPLFFSSRVPLRSVHSSLPLYRSPLGPACGTARLICGLIGNPLGCRPCLRDNRQVLAPSCQPCPFSLSLTLSLPLLSSGVFGVPSRGWSLHWGLILHSFLFSNSAFILKVGENN